MPNPFDNLQQRLMWKTRGENCPICDSLRGRVYTYDMWMSAGVWPGFHWHCDCTLIQVDNSYELSDLDFFGSDLNLLGDTFDLNLFIARLHWDPNWKPFAVYMTEQIMQSHLKRGKHLSIGQILKIMKQEYPGFFKRSSIFDNFFQWRVFRTVQHYDNIDDSWSGSVPSFSVFNYQHNLKPDSLEPYIPSQTYVNLPPPR